LKTYKMILEQEHMNPGKDKLLIFDCDGVLIDSEPLANRIFLQCLRSEGFDVDELYGEHFHGIALKDCLEKVETDFKRKVSDQFVPNLATLIDEEMKQSLQPIPNIKQALDQLPHPKCVASGSDHDRLRVSLSVTGLNQYFQHIFSSTDVQHGKPHPDIFLFAAQRMAFEKHQCVVIEDSYPGMQAGLAAEMKVLLYNPIWKDKYAIPEEVTVFYDMAELPALVDI
jgi:HAD superfamily hydrolase (TIGR01509 family)